MLIGLFTISRIKLLLSLHNQMMPMILGLEIANFLHIFMECPQCMLSSHASDFHRSEIIVVMWIHNASNIVDFVNCSNNFHIICFTTYISRLYEWLFSLHKAMPVCLQLKIGSWWVRYQINSSLRIRNMLIYCSLARLAWFQC